MMVVLLGLGAKTRVQAKTHSVPEVEKRLAEMDKILASDPKNIRALEIKISGLSILGRTREAEDICDYALKLRADRGFLWFFKGYCKSKNGDWKESIPFFEKGYKYGNVSSLGLMALSLRKLKRNSECIEFTTKYLKQYPGMYELYYNRGLAKLELHASKDSVCDDLRKAAELDDSVSEEYRSTCLNGSAP
jgi:tetratricopeptide (TPR) repeat protein